MCGAVAGESHPYDPSRKTRLHIGHIVDKSQGGTDNASNLHALCSLCNEGASNLTLDRPSAQKLLIQVRRAKGVDQLELGVFIILCQGLFWFLKFNKSLMPYPACLQKRSPVARA